MFFLPTDNWKDCKKGCKAKVASSLWKHILCTQSWPSDSLFNLAENGHIFVNIEIKEKSGMASLILNIKFRYCKNATKFEITQQHNNKVGYFFKFLWPIQNILTFWSTENYTKIQFLPFYVRSKSTSFFSHALQKI